MATSATAVTHPLAAGERLTLEQFLQRWEAQPDLKFAELIDGVVYLPSPLSIGHGAQDCVAGFWLSYYVAFTEGCQVLANATWRLLGQSPQPDLSLFILPEFGGRMRVEGELAAGVPDLVLEVSATSASIDLGVKLQLYQKAGVPEYVIFLLDEREVRWLVLDRGVYRRHLPDPDGLLRSTIFPGLWLDPAAALAGDRRRILETLQQGLASPEHAAFVEALASRQSASHERY